jgi:glycosyltransferase involved in cell wall biosynthesis
MTHRMERLNEDGVGGPEAPKILLFVYSCSPYRASEYAVGWGRARQAARFCETWVVCSPESEDDVRRYLQEHGDIPRLHVSFMGRHWLEAWIERHLPASELEHNYLAYRLWHRRAFRHAVRLHAEVGFSVAHQANTCGYREPGELRRLGVPFVWGPVGGTQNFPWRFLPELQVVSALREIARNVINIAQMRYSRRVRLACRSAATLLAANSHGEATFRRVHGKQPMLLLETGLDEVAGTTRDRSVAQGPLRLLWSGRLHPRKGLSLLIRALGQLPRDFEYTLRIVGDGSERQRCMALAEQVGVAARCQWMGALPYATVMEQYEWADVFVFSSLRDTSGNVVLEAMARGVPVICLDHHGARDMVTESSGIKISVTSRAAVTRQIAQAILQLGRDRHRLSALSVGAVARARDFLWERNGERMYAVYTARAASQPRGHAVAVPA